MHVHVVCTVMEVSRYAAVAVKTWQPSVVYLQLLRQDKHQQRGTLSVHNIPELRRRHSSEREIVCNDKSLLIELIEQKDDI